MRRARLGLFRVLQVSAIDDGCGSLLLSGGGSLRATKGGMPTASVDTGGERPFGDRSALSAPRTGLGRITISDSLACVKLILWDEASQRLVSLKEAQRRL